MLDQELTRGLVDLIWPVNTLDPTEELGKCWWEEVPCFACCHCDPILDKCETDGCRVLLCSHSNCQQAEVTQCGCINITKMLLERPLFVFLQLKYYITIMHSFLTPNTVYIIHGIWS